MTDKWGKSTIHVAVFVYVGCGLNCLPQTLDSTGQDTKLPLMKKTIQKRPRYVYPIMGKQFLYSGANSVDGYH